MLLDATLGEPSWLWSRIPHPAVVMGRMINWLDNSLNTGAFLRSKGVMLVLLLVAAALLLGWGLTQLGPVAEVLCAAIMIAQRSLVDHVSAVADALRRSLPEGRQTVAHIVSRDCSNMTTSQVTRAAIESASENLGDGVIAPLFWFAIAGLPGLLIYKMINTADSMIGYRTARYAEFGWASARFDDLLNLVPSRLTGLIIAALSGQMHDWPAIAADARSHRSPNAGWPEAAMARALNVALAGPRSYDGKMQQLAWVNGTARQDSGPEDIDDAVNMLWKAWGLALIVAIAFATAQTLL
ncbi:MAG: adenosylcobinamide-phosphate synthase CbiB [Rhodobacteraceae bacterium]|nr:adenosylcobinamide-phosphate synthase CbiB [Paracoccaceae bacterium]